MKQAYDKLEAVGVEVFSVKTDWFTIRAEQENAAMAILRKDVKNESKIEIGSWRVSECANITLPTKTCK